MGNPRVRDFIKPTPTHSSSALEKSSQLPATCVKDSCLGDCHEIPSLHKLTRWNRKQRSKFTMHPTHLIPSCKSGVTHDINLSPPRFFLIYRYMARESTLRPRFPCLFPKCHCPHLHPCHCHCPRHHDRGPDRRVCSWPPPSPPVVETTCVSSVSSCLLSVSLINLPSSWLVVDLLVNLSRVISHTPFAGSGTVFDIPSSGSLISSSLSTWPASLASLTSRTTSTVSSNPI